MITKRVLMKVLEKADDDAVVFIDNGTDSVECFGVDFVKEAALTKYDHVSTRHDGSFVPDGSIVLFFIA